MHLSRGVAMKITLVIVLAAMIAATCYGVIQSARRIEHPPYHRADICWVPSQSWWLPCSETGVEANI